MVRLAQSYAWKRKYNLDQSFKEKLNKGIDEATFGVLKCNKLLFVIYLLIIVYPSEALSINFLETIWFHTQVFIGVLKMALLLE